MMDKPTEGGVAGSAFRRIVITIGPMQSRCSNVRAMDGEIDAGNGGPMTGRVLLLGATGTVGSELVALLRERHVAVRAATRHPDAATAGRLRCESVEFDPESPVKFVTASNPLQ